MLERLRRKSRNPSVNPYMRIMDPDIGTPDAFYMMDEIRDPRRKTRRPVQVLRRYTKAEMLPEYCGTYEVLYKTERLGRFCLIMRRRPDEWKVPPEHQIQSEEELETMIIAEYYPDVLCRIYLKGLSEAAVKEITEEYVTRLLRSKRRRRLSAPEE